MHRPHPLAAATFVTITQRGDTTALANEGRRSTTQRTVLTASDATIGDEVAPRRDPSTRLSCLRSSL
jgi:hypothetical protein